MRTWGMAFLLAAASVGARAEDVGAQLKMMQAQLERLSEKVDSQQKTIEVQARKIEEQEKALTVVSAAPKTIAGGPGADLLERIERAEFSAASSEKRIRKLTSDRQRVNIGATVDTAFRYFDGANTQAERPAGNDFSVRGMELSFESEVDQYFKSYVIFNAVPDVEDNDEAFPALEEAAIYTTSLSHVQVKGGRFFVPFGRLSSVHEHALPFTTRPRSLEAYLGGESGGDGIQAQATVPIPHFLQITGGVFNKVGSEFPLRNGPDSRRNTAEMTFFSKAFTRFDVGNGCDGKKDHTIEWGLSNIYVPDHLIHRNLTNMEITYHWHPSWAKSKDKLVWGTEIMRNEIRGEQIFGEGTDDDPFRSTREQELGWGGYSYAEYFHNKHWSFGPRVDLFQNTDPNEGSNIGYDQTYTLFATYRFTEFSRVRAEFNRHEYFNGESSNEFYLQWTVFWGAHSHGDESHDHAH